jgi:serine/threonine protein kinase
MPPALDKLDTMASAPAQPTERLNERYALYGEIASGGMATVHFGRLLGPVGFSRTVAIKRLHQQFASEPEFVKMFVDEALLAARVRHPNVVATVDVVTTEGQLYLVMDYVQGEPLRRLWKNVQEKGGRIPRRIVAAIILGVLHGLHAAHEAKNEKGEPLGIVHRDVSPQNVLVGTDGVARVIDFGIAKAAVRMQTTGVGQLKGKPAYMAPEQILDKPATRQTDIYAASVILWEMLTGSRLFWAKADTEIVHNVLRRPVDRPSARVPSLLPALDDIVLKGLEREPSNRYATARDMAKAIEDCIAPASASDVGEWVERIGGDVLRARERRLKEIEDGSASPMSMPMRETRGSEPSPGTPLGQALSTVPEMSVPDLHLPTRAEVPLAKVREAMDSNLPTITHDVSPEGSSPGMGRELDLDNTLEGPTLEVDAPPEFARTLSMPGRVSPARVIAAEPPLPSRRFGSAWMLALTLIAAVAAVGVWWVPGYVLGRCMTAAALQGATLSVARLSVRPHAILLDGVKVTIADAPGVTATAAEVEIALTGLHATAVTARNCELSISGSVDAVANKFEAWRSKHGADPIPLDVEAGHVIWSGPLGEGTQLEAWDVSAQLLEHADRADDLRALARSAMVRVPRGSLGPWRLRLDRDAKAARLDVAFDTAVPEWATAHVIQPREGAGSVSISIPPSPIQRVGIASDLFAPVGDPAMQVEARLDFAPVNGDKYEGKATLNLLGARAGHARVPMDLKLDAALSGPSTSSIALAGSLSVGGIKGALTGTVTTQTDSVRGQLSWRPPQPSCPEGSATEPKQAGRHKGVAPASWAPQAVPFDFDSADAAAAGVRSPPTGCVLGVFPDPGGGSRKPPPNAPENP